MPGGRKAHRDHVVIRELVAGASPTQAALNAHVDPSTVMRRLRNDPDFVAKLEAEREAVMAEIRAAVVVGALEGVSVLRELAANSTDEWLRADCAQRLVDIAALTNVAPYLPLPTRPTVIVRLGGDEGLLDNLPNNGEAVGPEVTIE